MENNGKKIDNIFEALDEIGRSYIECGNYSPDNAALKLPQSPPESQPDKDTDIEGKGLTGSIVDIVEPIVKLGDNLKTIMDLLALDLTQKEVTEVICHINLFRKINDEYIAVSAAEKAKIDKKASRSDLMTCRISDVLTNYYPTCDLAEADFADICGRRDSQDELKPVIFRSPDLNLPKRAGMKLKLSDINCLFSHVEQYDLLVDAVIMRSSFGLKTVNSVYAGLRVGIPKTFLNDTDDTLGTCGQFFCAEVYLSDRMAYDDILLYNHATNSYFHCNICEY